MPQYGRAAVPSAAGSVFVFGIVAVVGAFAVAQGLTNVSFSYTMGAIAALILFALAFVRTDFGIYVVIFSMLLSPQFGSKGSGVGAGRGVTLRTEDFVLIVIGLSWLAKTAVNKELNLIARTPLNWPILVYVATNIAATLLGYMMGSVRSVSGYFYVLKYVEYFVIYYMAVNNLRDREHAWRLVGAAFITAAIVSVIGLAQVPSGERVSAPFEGEIGEPNTFGGYLLLMMAIAAGVAIETDNLRRRVQCLVLFGLMAVPFFFTLSRASYLGLIPAFLVIARFTTRRRFITGLILFLAVCSPILIYVAPKSVKDRVVYTFQEEKGSETVRVGKVAFDPSTSARLISFRAALDGFSQRPIFGWGVTGFGFMDAQYARVLAETGIVGLAAFLWLCWSVWRHARDAYVTRGDPEERGLVLGFLAGFVGLLVHAFGSNTFIIVRIMEPFWLFTGIVMMIPVLEARERAAAAAAAAAAKMAAPKKERVGVRP
ncbi:MAG TPA: O-antigen ligase family protein [Methylomirabilota bacterium]|jgi:O-antigen ligase|nr:O-antigen ligase family protein [Methylomirabilota bacterium]